MNSAFSLSKFSQSTSSKNGCSLTAPTPAGGREGREGEGGGGEGEGGGGEGEGEERGEEK